jgi:hypothetical protein
MTPQSRNRSAPQQNAREPKLLESITQLVPFSFRSPEKALPEADNRIQA